MRYGIVRHILFEKKKQKKVSNYDYHTIQNSLQLCLHLFSFFKMRIFLCV